MPKYWGTQIFTQGSFPKVGQKQKTERKRKKEERAKVGNNNGQLRIATTPRVAHANPPGPIGFDGKTIFYQICAYYAQCISPILIKI